MGFCLKVIFCLLNGGSYLFEEIKYIPKKKRIDLKMLEF